MKIISLLLILLAIIPISTAVPVIVMDGNEIMIENITFTNKTVTTSNGNIVYPPSQDIAIKYWYLVFGIPIAIFCFGVLVASTILKYLIYNHINVNVHFK